MKVLVAILMMFISSQAFGTIYPNLKKSNPRTIRSRAIGTIFKNVEDRINGKYKTTCIGTNIAAPDDVVKLLGLQFQVWRPMSKEEIRRFLAEGFELLKDEINNNEQIQPFLHQRPFNDIVVILFIRDWDGRYLYHPNIGVAECRRGKFEYNTYKVGSRFLKRELPQHENYE